MTLLARCRDPQFRDAVLAAAPIYSRDILNRLHVSEADARFHMRLAASLNYADASLRAAPDILASNRLGQSDLWGYAISGDLPVLLLRLPDPRDLALARRLVDAHSYWRLHGLATDLVIVGEDRDGRAPLLQQIAAIARAHGGPDALGQPGGIFVLPAGAIDNEHMILLQTVARVVIDERDANDGAWAGRIAQVGAPAPARKAALVTGSGHETGPTVSARNKPPRQSSHFCDRRLFPNGLGGLTRNGREYAITVDSASPTPMPWVNDPGEIYRKLTQELGDPLTSRIEAPATLAQRTVLSELSPQQVKSTELAGESIERILVRAPGNDAPIGGLKVIAESGWFAARPSGTEDLYKIYAESFRVEEHLRRVVEAAQAIVDTALKG